MHTANTKPRVQHPADYRADDTVPLAVVDVDALSSSYIPPHRHDRLDDLLAQTQNATLADMALIMAMIWPRVMDFESVWEG